MNSVFNELTFKRQPDIQYKSKEEIAAFQNERLQEQMAYVYAHSPYYRRVFDESHVSPEDIKTVADLQRLPVTTKTELQKFNNDFFCVPQSEIVDIVTTSGTTGDPVVVGLTKHDLDRLSYNEFLTFSAAELT